MKKTLNELVTQTTEYKGSDFGSLKLGAARWLYETFNHEFQLSDVETFDEVEGVGLIKNLDNGLSIIFSNKGLAKSYLSSLDMSVDNKTFKNNCRDTFVLQASGIGCCTYSNYTQSPEMSVYYGRVDSINRLTGDAYGEIYLVTGLYDIARINNNKDEILQRKKN